MRSSTAQQRVLHPKLTLLVLGFLILMTSVCGGAELPTADPVERLNSSNPAANPTASDSGLPAVPTLLLSATQVAQLRGQSTRMTALLKRCDRELSVLASPVRDYKPADHYTHTGSTAPQAQSQALADNGWTAYRAGLCYLISQDIRYAKQSRTIIHAWSQTLLSVAKGQAHADINYAMPAYILAASWTRGSAEWDEVAFRQFLTKVIAPASTAGKSNNHGNWGVLLDTLIAAYLNDRHLLDTAQRRWAELLLAQVDADGSLPQEICRSATSNWCGGADKGIKGIAYTHYALLPAAMAAQVFSSINRPVFDGPAAAALARAYAQAAKWTLKPETFPFYDSNAGQLSGIRNAAYFSILQQHLPHPDGASVLAQGNLGLNGFELILLFSQSP